MGRPACGHATKRPDRNGAMDGGDGAGRRHAGVERPRGSTPGSVARAQREPAQDPRKERPARRENWKAEASLPVMSRAECSRRPGARSAAARPPARLRSTTSCWQLRGEPEGGGHDGLDQLRRARGFMQQSHILAKACHSGAVRGIWPPDSCPEPRGLSTHAVPWPAPAAIARAGAKKKKHTHTATTN